MLVKADLAPGCLSADPGHPRETPLPSARAPWTSGSTIGATTTPEFAGDDRDPESLEGRVIALPDGKP
jgi:hypothetical protein